MKKKHESEMDQIALCVFCNEMDMTVVHLYEDWFLGVLVLGNRNPFLNFSRIPELKTDYCPHSSTQANPSLDA